MVEDIDLGRFFEIATGNKIYVNSLNLHKMRNGILQDYTGDLELNGLMNFGPIEHKTNTRFKNRDDFEGYINAIDIDHYSEDVAFTGYVYKLNTPQFNIVKRSVYAKGTNYMQEIVGYGGQNCYIPTSGHCFIKRFKCFTIGCFDGTRRNPRKITQRNTSLFIRIFLFCLIWKSNVITFKQATENEL